MKYHKGDLVMWDIEWEDNSKSGENVMIIKEAFKAEIRGLPSYYRYSYIETGREDSYLSDLYDEHTQMLG